MMLLQGTAPPEVGMGFVIAMLTVITIILGPIAWALARRLGRKADPDSALRAEVEQLHTRLSEMDSLQSRLIELEERVDFTERLLAQVQQPARLGERIEEGGR
jgi:tetrahydromethanopterin S-methyltransferase subunit G